MTIDDAIRGMEHPITKQLKRLRSNVRLLRELPFTVEIKRASDDKAIYTAHCTYYPYWRTTNSLGITKKWPSIQPPTSHEYTKYKDVDVKRVLNPRPRRYFNGLICYELVGTIVVRDEDLNEVY